MFLLFNFMSVFLNLWTAGKLVLNRLCSHFRPRKCGVIEYEDFMFRGKFQPNSNLHSCPLKTVAPLDDVSCTGLEIAEAILMKVTALPELDPWHSDPISIFGGKLFNVGSIGPNWVT